MASQLRGNELRRLGFPEGRAIGLALAQLQRQEFKRRPTFRLARGGSAPVAHCRAPAPPRPRAKAELGEGQVRQYLQAHGVELIGGGLDEAPQAYKDLRQVMASQQELVEVLGTFTPKIGRMAGGS